MSYAVMKSVFQMGTPVNRRSESDLLGYVPIKRRKGGKQAYHGAFTGGFSAGYFNTVGSEEGFQPKEFRSSWKNRAERRDTILTDLMDEEDLATNTTLLSVKSQFDANRRARLYRTQGGLGFELGASVMSTSEMTLGDKILYRWGWKPGKSIGRKKKKITRPDNAGVAEVFFEDPMLQNPPIKNDHYGIGYVRDEIDINREDGRRREKEQDQSGGRIHTKSSSAAMGLGALEEVSVFDDVYRQTDKSEYSTSIAAQLSEDDDDDFAVPKVPAKRKRKKSRWGHRKEKESWVEGFVSARKRRKLDDLKRFSGPVVPPGYVPEHKFESDTITLKGSIHGAGILSASDRSGWHKMTDEMRKEILQEMKLWEEPEEDNKPKKFIGQNNKKKLKDRLAGKFEVGDQLNYENTVAGLQLSNQQKKMTTEEHIERARDKFSDNPGKQSRFDTFLNTKLGKKVLHAPTIVHQTELQRQLESEEFEKVYEQLAKKCKLDVNVLAKREGEEEKTSVNYGTMTRSTTVWQPERMLCRRFNVPFPKFSDLEEGMLRVQSNPREDISIHDILKPPNLPKETRKSRWGPSGKNLAGGPHQLKLGKLTEETTTAEKSDRINLILSSSAQDSMGVAEEEQNTDLFDAVFNVPDSDDSDYEEQLARTSPSPEPERSAVPPKRVMTAAGPPPTNAIVPVNPNPAPPRPMDSGIRISKPASVGYTALTSGMVGAAQQSTGSDNPLDALLSRVSASSLFTSVLNDTPATSTIEPPKVSIVDMREPPKVSIVDMRKELKQSVSKTKTDSKKKKKKKGKKKKKKKKNLLSFAN